MKHLILAALIAIPFFAYSSEESYRDHFFLALSHISQDLFESTKWIESELERKCGEQPSIEFLKQLPIEVFIEAHRAREVTQEWNEARQLISKIKCE